jgi:Zn-dependent membrane protease YugP
VKVLLTAKEFAEYLLIKEGIKDCLVKRSKGIGSNARPRLFKGGMKIHLKEFDKTDWKSFYVAAHEVGHVINIKKNESFFNKYWLMRNFIIFLGSTYLLFYFENMLFGFPLFSAIKPFL